MSTELDKAREALAEAVEPSKVPHSGDFIAARCIDLMRLIAREEIARSSAEGGDHPNDEQLTRIVSNGDGTATIVMGGTSPQPVPERGGDAYKYAVRLFRHLAPQCTPLPDIYGVLTQIDNATTVIPKLEAEATRLRTAVEDTLRIAKASGVVSDKFRAITERLTAALTGPETKEANDAQVGDTAAHMWDEIARGRECEADGALTSPETKEGGDSDRRDGTRHADSQAHIAQPARGDDNSVPAWGRVAGPYKYDDDNHSCYRIEGPDRLLGVTYASDGDEEAAEALALTWLRAAALATLREPTNV